MWLECQYNMQGNKFRGWMLFTGDDSKHALINHAQEKVWDPAGIQTPDLLNTSQTLLPLSSDAFP